MALPKRIVFGDFETFYGKGYTLKSPDTTVTSYVRDARFKVHGMALKLPSWRKFRWLHGAALERALLSVDWATTAFCAHNAQFDGLILVEHYGIIPAFYYDTLAMARALHDNTVGNGLDEVAQLYGLEGKLQGVLDKLKDVRDPEPALLAELGTYAIQDGVLLEQVFRRMVAGYPESELQLIDLTTRAFCDSKLRVDPKVLQEEIRREEQKERDLFTKFQAHFGFTSFEQTSTALKSNKQFPELLQRFGVEPPTKISPTTGKQTYALAQGDLAFQALYEHPNPLVRQLMEARACATSNIALSRAKRLLNDGVPTLPVPLKYWGAHTGRWSGSGKINLQNLPSRTDSELRKAIVAPPGYVLVVVDSSQIEDRVNLWLAQQLDILDLYRRGEDVYSHMAARIYGMPVEEVLKDKKLPKGHPKRVDFRRLGKVARLGLGYGCGVDKFHYIVVAGVLGAPMDITWAEASRTVQIYREANARIRALWQFLGARLEQMALGGAPYGFNPEPGQEPILWFHPDHIITPSGLPLWYRDLRPEGGIVTQHNPFTGRAQVTLVGDLSYRSGPNTRSRIHGALLDENIVQHLARTIVADQILLVAERYPILLSVHDEVMYLAPTSEAEEAYQFGLRCFSTSKGWYQNIPLKGSGNFGQNYYEAKQDRE